MTDFLTEKRQQIADRLKELEPLVEEYRRLEAAAAALGKLASAPAATTTATTHSAADRDARAERQTVRAKQPQPLLQRPLRPPPRSRQHRKKRCGKVAADGAKAAARAPLRRSSAVQGQPGITIPELAAKMAIQTTYLYRVLPGLEKERKVEKKGRGWFPREG